MGINRRHGESEIEKKRKKKEVFDGATRVEMPSVYEIEATLYTYHVSRLELADSSMLKFHPII